MTRTTVGLTGLEPGADYIIETNGQSNTLRADGAGTTSVEIRTMLRRRQQLTETSGGRIHEDGVNTTRADDRCRHLVGGVLGAQLLDERDETFARPRREAPVSWHPPTEFPSPHEEQGFRAVVRNDDINTVSHDTRTAR